MKSLLKSLTSRRARKFYLWGGIGLVTFVVLFYQVANWRGAKAWHAAQERLEAEGENQSAADLSPSPIPDAENFFGTPALKNIAMTDGDDSDTGPHAELRKQLEDLSIWRPAEGVEATPPRRERGSLEPTDFDAWVEYLKATGALSFDGVVGDTSAALFLAALDRAHGTLFDTLAEASLRPGAVIEPTFPVQLAEGKRFYNISVPHYTGLQTLARIMALRAAAAAQIGDAARAGESLRIISRLAEASRTVPILIGTLVAMAFDEIHHRTTWEVLQAGAADKDFLKGIEQALTGIAHRATILNAIRGELVGALDAMEWIDEDGISPVMMVSEDGKAEGPVSLLARLIPSGWIDQNRAYFVNWYLDYTILPLKNGGLSQAMDKAKELEELIIKEHEGWINPHTVMPMIAMPMLSSILRKTVHAEANRRMLLLACALERYRLDSGSYPDSPAALVPEFIAEIPADPSSAEGDALCYLKEGERYRIWSIALDRDDDAGRQDPEKKPTHRKYDGDWVWKFTG